MVNNAWVAAIDEGEIEWSQVPTWDSLLEWARYLDQVVGVVDSISIWGTSLGNFEDSLEWEVSVEDIEEGIEVQDNIWQLTFYYWEKLIWVIEYIEECPGIFSIDFIWTINSTSREIEERDLKERYQLFFSLEDTNVKISGLLKYMYREFYKIIKQKGWSSVSWITRRGSILHITDELATEGVISHYEMHDMGNWASELIRYL